MTGAAPLDLEPARLAFLEESRELLRGMEEGLLNLGEDAADADALIAVFRAAHTIKGSAGVFGYDGIVDFTHGVEGLLEEARRGAVRVDADTVALLLACADHMGYLVDCAAAGEEPEAERAAAGAALAHRIAAILPAALPAEVAQPHAEGSVEAIGGGAVQSDTWHVSARFGADVLREGMDPLSILAYLRTLGTVASIATLREALPALADMDPEACYLGIELDLAAPRADKAAIESAFEFLGDSCLVRILPPHSKVEDYLRLIEELPEDSSRLGRLLVDSGALTERELAEGLAQLEAAGPAARLGEVLTSQGAVAAEVVDAALRKQRTTADGRRVDAGAMRVRADKLDELIDLVGELVIAGSATSLIARREGSTALVESTATLAELVERIRDGALRLRMVPVGELFGRFRRTVHDLGRDLGKQVELLLTGAETEMDKGMIEGLADPLMHIVRNAMDHGLEPAAERVAAGKPAIGTVRLNAYHDSGSIVIEVADDGRGLDRARILAKAEEAGLVAPGEALSDDQVLALIMRPGFSTAQSVTNVSGRGIGMDVVKRNVDALRGAVAIESEPGVGTKFMLRVPLTLAIIDGFLFDVGGAGYVVPLESVVECVELPPAQRAAVESSGFLDLRGQVLPVLRLSTFFGIESARSRRENVVVVQHGSARVGLVVDALHGEFQTVIKPLGRLFGALRGVSGSTILGTGEVALILDVPELMARAVAADGARLARSASSIRTTAGANA